MPQSDLGRATTLRWFGIAVLIFGAALETSSAIRLNDPNWRPATALISHGNPSATVQVTAVYSGEYWPELLLDWHHTSMQSNLLLQGLNNDSANRMLQKAVAWTIHDGNKQVPLRFRPHYYAAGGPIIWVAGSFLVVKGQKYTVTTELASAPSDLWNLDPRLQVEPSPMGSKDNWVIASIETLGSFVLAVVALILLSVAFVLRRRSRHPSTLAHER